MESISNLFIKLLTILMKNSDNYKKIKLNNPNPLKVNETIFNKIWYNNLS